MATERSDAPKVADVAALKTCTDNLLARAGQSIDHASAHIEGRSQEAPPVNLYNKLDQLVREVIAVQKMHDIFHTRLRLLDH